MNDAVCDAFFMSLSETRRSGFFRSGKLNLLNDILTVFKHPPVLKLNRRTDGQFF